MSEASNTITEQQAAAVLEKGGGDKLKACLSCEKCLSTCFLTDTYPGMTPREIPLKILSGNMQELVESEFIWACTLCTRCTVDCPENIHMDVIVRALRGIARSQGRGYKRLEDGLQQIKEIGNSVGISSEEFVENIEWLGEDAAGEIEGLDEDEFKVPIDKEGADYLYIPNPREFTSAPHLFSVYLKFFLAINADWTFASNLCDISNWAYYLGDDETNLWLIKRTVDTARRLGVKAVVSTECGHGYKILKKDAEEVIGEPLGFEVTSVVELAHRHFKDGTLKLGKGVIDESVTYHDPCNVGRKLGVYEPPRELLRHIAKEYIEMDPHSKYAVCCAGGGSVAQNTDMGQKRLANAKPKADQIVATGAKIVTSSCQMCLAQLMDIQAHYVLPVTVKSVMELVIESMEE